MRKFVGTETRPAGQWDAELFLELDAALKSAYRRVSRAQVSTERRERWQRRMVRISEFAQSDLQRALLECRRLTRELDRHLL